MRGASTAPRGPRAPAIVQGATLQRDPVGFLSRCRERYGDPFAIRLGRYRVAYTADPEAVKAIVAAGEPDLIASKANALIEPLVGSDGLLLIDGERHTRRRRLVMPPLHGAALATYADVIDAYAEEELSSWQPESEVVVRDRMQALTLRVILRVVFGMADAQRDAHAVRVLAGFVDEGSNLALFLGWLRRDLGSRSPWGRFLRRRAAARDLVRELIAQRHASGDRGTDLLSLLLDARDDEGRPLEDHEVEDEVLTALLAGHETTATALAWGIDCLLRWPEQAAAVREALQAGDEEPLEQAVSEVLRLRPPVFDCVRMACRPFAVRDSVVPEGTIVAPLITLLHRDPELWPEPDRFDPARFAGGEAQHGFAYLPFGGGRRRCVGAALARAEIRIVLRRWLLHGPGLELLQPEPEHVRLSTVTLVPASGVRVRVSRSVQTI